MTFKWVKYLGFFWLILLVNPILADVTMETLAKISMIGGLGNVESSTKTEIKGLKKSEDATVKMTGGIMGTMEAKPQRQVTITRLDKGVIWNVDHNQKTYTELPIALPNLPTEEEAAKVKHSEYEYEIVKSEFSVSPTGKKKEINGFACQEYVANWVLELQKITTKEKTKSTMKLNLWTTPKNDLIKGLEKQENEFNQQLMAKLGMKVSPEEMKKFGGEFVTSMFAIKSDDVNKKLVNLKEELQKIEGYPIVTEINWLLEGDSTQSTKTETPSDIGGMLAQALAKKGKKPEVSEAKPAFYSYIEIKSIKLSEIPDKNFEVPQGYKLVK